MKKSVVYKYPIPFLESFDLTLPRGSKVVRVDVVDGLPYLWALVPLNEDISYTYYFKGSKTGGEFEHENDLVFVGCYAIYVQMELMLYMFLDKIVDADGKELSMYDTYVNNCWRG